MLVGDKDLNKAKRDASYPSEWALKGAVGVPGTCVKIESERQAPDCFSNKFGYWFCKGVTSVGCTLTKADDDKAKSDAREQAAKEKAHKDRAAKQVCADLVSYRDTSLAADLDKAVKGYTGSKDSLNLLKKTRDESRIIRQQVPVNEARLKVMMVLKLSANAVGGILSLDPKTGAIIQTGRKSGKWVNRIIVAAETTSLAEAIANNSVLEQVITDSLTERSGIGAALAATYELSNDLIELKGVQKDGVDTLAALDSSLAHLESLISRLDKKLNSKEFRIEAINKRKSEIDKICHIRS
jgi:hypothetical protein